MTDDPTVGAEGTDIDDEAATPADGGDTARRPSPSAQAASRARRIGGRPAPGPAPSRPAADPATVTKPAPAKKAPGAKRAASQASADETPAPRRGGLRAARAAAAERTAGSESTAETERPTSLRTRPPGKPATVTAGAAKSDAARIRRRLELVRWTPAAVLGVAVVVLAVLCVLLGHGAWYGTKSVSEVRGEVLSAAKTCTAKVSSYDYRKLAQSKKDGQSCATGKFKKDYTTAMDTIVAKEAPATKTAQSVQVAKAGIEQVSSDGKQWTLLIYGQHTVTNTTTGATTPRLDKLSVRVTMDKVGSKWLISKIDLVDG